MRIFMLGWEYPPFIAGGLGTACAGLTKALNRQGHEVTFVLPKSIGGATSPHVKLLGPDSLRSSVETIKRMIATSPGGIDLGEEGVEEIAAGVGALPNLPGVVVPPASAGIPPIPDATTSAYPQFNDATFRQALRTLAEQAGTHADPLAELIGLGGSKHLSPKSARELAAVLSEIVESIEAPGGGETHYGHDLFGDAHRYAKLVCALGVQEQFDVIHANDWLTFPAGLALKAMTGKPLVVHVHATEFDRSGDCPNQQVYDLERSGIHGADRIIAVSRLTKTIVEHKYGGDTRKVDVVYNGVDQDEVQPHAGDRIERDDKIVLFLGRITMQKGPEYFVRAAKRVLEKEDKVKFVVAGSGDMAVRMIEEAAHLGIGHKMLFTGFLRGRDVDRVFQLADCYVMPSVSEPFGIAPLEAMRNNTPVIVSKQSGVSEVLTHALKVDFWDIDDMASKIVAILRYPPLAETLQEHGAFELRRLTWDGAAEKTVKVYGRAIGA